MSRRRALRVGDVVVSTVAIAALRVPPGSLIRTGTHGVVVRPTGDEKWLVRFDTGYVVEVEDDDLELHEPLRPTRLAGDQRHR